jgi:amino acid transporter
MPAVDGLDGASVLGSTASLNNSGSNNNSNGKDVEQDDGDNVDDSNHKRRTLTFGKLCLFAFSSVAGGPYGFEDAVGAAGAKITLLMVFVAGALWSAPLALMTAELSSALPENGGHILWIDKAFGPFWSFLNGHWSLISGVFEGGLFAVLFLDYLEPAFGKAREEFYDQLRVPFGVVLMFVVVSINMYGMEMVANASVLFAVASLGPFIALVMVGFPKLDWQACMQAEVPKHELSNGTFGPDWHTFLIILLWSTAGYDLLGSCAGEVKNPAKTFVRAMFTAMGFALLVDFFSIAVGYSVLQDPSKWEDGTFTIVAKEIGGNALELVFLVGAAVSTVGLLCTLLSTTSRITYGMAVVGTLPKVFARVDPKNNNPYVAMIMNALLMMMLFLVPFEVLAELEMWFYCATTVMKFAALLKLREVAPAMKRPYRIPLSGIWLYLFCAPPLVCCFIVMFFAKKITIVVGIIGVVFSIIMYYVALAIAGPSGKLIRYDLIDEL